MIQKNEREKIEVYEIDNKKYTVISKNVDNPNNVEKLYNILCKFALSKINTSMKK